MPDPRPPPPLFVDEIGHESWRETLSCVQEAGYREFKIINQQTYTDTTPIQDNEYFARALRKLCTLAPSLKPVARSIMTRQDFDTFLDRFAWTKWEGTSGPFGEDTFGPWQSANEIAARFASIVPTIARAKRVSWFDLHAR